MPRNPATGAGPVGPAPPVVADQPDRTPDLAPQQQQDLTAVTPSQTADKLRAQVEEYAAVPAGTPQVRASWQRVTISWKNIPNPSPTDWIGLFRYDEPFKLVCWCYINGQASGNGTMVIPAGTVPGRYDLRLFSNNTYTRLGIGRILQVVSGVLVGAGLHYHTPGANLRPSWSGIPYPTTGDWIGLYRLGAAETDHLAYRYTDGKAAGITDLIIPSSTPPGRYELRLFSNDSTTRLTTSEVTVAGPASVFISQPASSEYSLPLQPGTQLVVGWSGIPAPTGNDWFGLYQLGAPDDPPVGYEYTNSAVASGGRTFTIPTAAKPGRYELRLFSEDSYTRLATSLHFRVTPDRLANYPSGLGPFWENPPVTSPVMASPRGLVVVSWQHIIPSSPADWVGLYTPGAPHDQYLAWRYTDGSSVGVGALSVPNGLAPGEYHMRLFRNDTYTQLASTYLHL